MNYPYKNLTTYTLPTLLERSVTLYSKNKALGTVSQEAFTYNEFYTQVKKTIDILRENGISQGDKVLLLSENMPQWAIAYFAVTFFGAIIVPILPDFHPEDVHRIIEHSEVKAVFVSKKHLQTIKQYNDDKTHIDFIIELESLKILDELSKKKTISKLLEPLYLPREDDPASLIYTSGTTGNSKGVMLSHKNLVTNAMSAYIQVTIKPEDIFLSILPLAHTLESTVGLIVPILHGSSIYYIDKVPTPSVLVKAFKLIRPTMMISVPLIIEKIYKSKVLPQFTNSFILKNLYKVSFIRKKLNAIAGKKLLETFGGRLRFFGIGGAGISPFVEQFLIEANFPFIIGYGLTETAPLLAGSILGEKIKHRSTGVAMAGVELKIKNRDPQTGEGEIIAKSPSIMIGYYKDEKRTAEVMEDGWFSTGDLGYIDDEGYLFISGRSKNVIIGSGGENIYPEQIEAVINQNKFVLDALMLQKEHQLIAKINLNYELLEESLTEENKIELLEEIRKDINSQISSFSRMVKFIEEKEPFIKTPTKKIKRYLYTE